MIDAKSYEELAAAYSSCDDPLRIHDVHYRFIAQCIRRYAPRDSSLSIVDAGCGNGYMGAFLSEQFPCPSIRRCAFDLARQLVERSATRNPNVQHTVAALPDTPYNDAEFDIVVSTGVLEHCMEPLASLRELVRIMAPDGFMVITIPNGDRMGMDRYLRNRKRFQPADDYFYTFAEAQNLFRRAGLRIHEYEGYGAFVSAAGRGGMLARAVDRVYIRCIDWLMRHVHPDSSRLQQRILFLLRRDDYLLNHDF